MSHTNRNFVIAYILLVGFPVLGLLGVLKSGRALSAPVSVDGTWKFQADAGQISLSPCLQSLPWLHDAPLSVSQSGPGLALTWNGGTKPMASGSIDGTAIKASIPASAVSSACRNDNLNLIATVDPKSEPRAFSGTLTVDGCVSCTPVTFRATRQPRSTPKGSH